MPTPRPKSPWEIAIYLLKVVTFYEIWKAMAVVFMHMFDRTVTVQYPHARVPLPDRHRGALCLLRYEDGKERCIGCDLCEAACPSHCIKVVSEEIPGEKLARFASAFYIDMTKCVFCGYCVEACPVNALGMTKMYEYATHDKRLLMFDKARLYQIGEDFYGEAKAYLVAHNQEKVDEFAKTYRYQFPKPKIGAGKA